MDVPDQGPADGGRAAPMGHLTLAHVMMVTRVTEYCIIYGWRGWRELESECPS